jgi:DNA-binding transcriptional LysR family regulator
LTLGSDLRNYVHLPFPLIALIDMEFRDIEYFAVLAEHGHMGRAAEALGLSQPALSLSLRRLERSIQAKLVKRTPKGVELTSAGSALLVQVHRLRLVREDVVREVADLSEGRTGHLRIGANTGVQEALVGAACAVLLGSAPRVTLKVTVIAVDPLMAALRNGEVDLAVSGIPPMPSEDLFHEHLLDDEFVVYASVKHRLAKRKQLTVADLAQERWASTDSGVSAQGLRRAFEEHGLPVPRIAVSSNATSVRFRAVAGSDLLGFTAKGLLRQVAQQYGFVELPVKKLSWQRSVGVIYRKEAYLSPTARRFIDILKSPAREISKEG